MSLFTTMTTACPKCSHPASVAVVGSLNADRRPDLRQEILDRTFQEIVCEKCENRFRLPPSFTYLDFGRNQWILAHPFDELEHWPDFEQQALDLFQNAYGPNTPETAQELGRNTRARIVFGWPALREKLVCADLDIDDAELELTKLAIIRNVQKLPFQDDAELRLTGAEDDTLTLAWTLPAFDRIVAEIDVPQSAYDAIVEDAAWADLRWQLSGNPFTDLSRLLIPAV